MACHMEGLEQSQGTSLAKQKNGRCPRRTCCVFTVPPDACGFSANAKRWPCEPKHGQRPPCHTCRAFAVQRGACGVNAIASRWPGEPKKTATPGRACCALTVPPDARAACHVEPPKRATRSRYAGPPMLFERDRACLELSFPAMPHACARRTPLYAPCGVRSPAWPRQDGVPPAGLHARAALNRETRENRENRENRFENRLKNKRKP